jgi:hypothetical protein
MILDTVRFENLVSRFCRRWPGRRQQRESSHSRYMALDMAWTKGSAFFQSWRALQMPSRPVITRLFKVNRGGVTSC